MLKGTVIILLALVAFAPCGLWLQRHYANFEADPIEAQALFAVPQECRPEPGERLIYLSGLLLIPALIFVFSRIIERSRLSVRLGFVWMESIGLCLLTGGLMWFTAFATSGDKDDAGNGHYHVRFNFFREHPATLVFVPLLMAAGSKYMPRRALAAKWYWSLAGTVALAPWAASVFSDRWFYASQWHFNAVFDSVVRVYLGKTLLVDSTSQYGLYAWFLAPLFRCTGLTVAKFTFVMGLLSAGSFFMIGVFLWRQVSHPLLAVVGLIATLFNGWMLFLTVEGPHRGAYLDLYFQYVPLRLLFPAILLGLAGCWLNAPRPALGRLIWAMLACGLLWNLDSGAPAFMAWVLTLFYVELEPHRPSGRLLRVAGEFLTACLALAGVFSLYALSCRWTAGAWPDFSLLFRSQYIFYAHGFAMLPMPWPGTWMAVIAIYLSGLTFAAIAHAQGYGNSKTRATFLVSVLGLMLFSYYQGRSHRAVLILAWWPIFPLMTLLLDSLFKEMSTFHWRMLPVGLLGCLPAVILIGSVASFFENVTMVGDYAGRQLGALMYSKPGSFDTDAAIISAYSRAGKPTWIISSREASLHLATRRTELAPCSFNELLLMADYPKLANKLAAQPDVCIWIDRGYFEAALSHHQGVLFVADFLPR
ncbi:MAG TPA: hypothetical protein VGP68_19985, partial [Gemmataceae bacterium]|nr:hypothetical protein [Gemmataceae bacterium]